MVHHFNKSFNLTKICIPRPQSTMHLVYSNNIRHCAFTLAEVLITLGIIGVVAALTLPAVINNTQNKQLEAGLKKGASEIAQALIMHQADTGNTITSNTEKWILKSAIKDYFKGSKDCGFGSQDLATACVGNNSDIYKNFNNTATINLGYFDDGQIILPDGVFIAIENSTPGRVYISIDVNGFKKKPNRLGHDLFMFEIDNEGKLLPMGAKDTDYYSENDTYCSHSSNSNMNGAACTQKALTDSKFWKNLP